MNHNDRVRILPHSLIERIETSPAGCGTGRPWSTASGASTDAAVSDLGARITLAQILTASTVAGVGRVVSELTRR